jgi:acyl carrier protein
MSVLDQLITIQRDMAAIWAKELNVAQVGPEDEFFALGGDSVNVLNMLFQVNRQFGIELAPGVLFENPALKDFSLVTSRAIDSDARNVVSSAGVAPTSGTI